MSMDRRKFLKIAGLSALVGLGGSEAFELLQPGAVDASEGHEGEGEANEGHEGPYAGDKIRWGIAIDIIKLGENPAMAKKIITTCHYEHNVPDWGNPKDAVKWIWEDDYEHSFPDSYNDLMAEKVEGMPFLLLCNHCDRPPCVRVCPTKATFRRPDGVVAMDYHRCIGCRFCMAACPYGSRSFNWLDPRIALKREGRKLNPRFPTRMRGVVEKCNLCVERLDAGKLPACVEAAPDIMIFGNLVDADSPVRKVLRERVSMRRKIQLGSKPSVFYLV